MGGGGAGNQPCAVGGDGSVGDLRLMVSCWSSMDKLGVKNRKVVMTIVIFK